MLDCHNATFLMSQARERPLGLAERMRLRLHAAMCSACARFERQLPLLGQAARHHADGLDGGDV
jgi:hypothetical protein